MPDVASESSLIRKSFTEIAQVGKIALLSHQRDHARAGSTWIKQLLTRHNVFLLFGCLPVIAAMADYTNGVGPSTSSSSSSSSFLTLILDLNPASWSSTSGTPIASFLPVILVFLSSHLALSHSNGVAFYVCSTQGRGDLIYSTASHSYRAERGDDDDDDEEADSHNDASTYQHFGQMNRAVVRGVKRMIARLQADAKRESEQTNGASKEDGIEEEEEEEETAIVKVLSMALNRE